MDLPIRVELWANTSPIPQVLTSAGTYLRLKTTSHITKTAPAECTCTCRGGSTTKSSTSRADITSKFGVDFPNRVRVSEEGSNAIRRAEATGKNSRTITAGTMVQRSDSPDAAR